MNTKWGNGVSRQMEADNRKLKVVDLYWLDAVIFLRVFWKET